MAKAESPLRVGSRVKHSHFGEGRIKEFLHDGATSVVETVDKQGQAHAHYAKTSDLKRVEAK